jgi:hypothetical protein
MAHFARLNDDNIVTTVVVIADEDCLDSDGNESEAVGIAFCKKLWGVDTDWVQTSYTSSIRFRGAAKGIYFDEINDVFRGPQPYPSWTLNTSTWEWDAPVALPSDEGFNTETGNIVNYTWDEVLTSWTNRTVVAGPYPSWAFNTSTSRWEPPVALPSDAGPDDEDDPTESVSYDWDEDSTSWANRTVHTLPPPE